MTPVSLPHAHDLSRSHDAALKQAVEIGDPLAVQAALTQNADPNKGRVITQDGIATYLTHAVRQRGNRRVLHHDQRNPVRQQAWLAIACALMQAGADPTLTNKDGATVWHVAALHLDHDALKALLKINPEGINVVRWDGRPPLNAIASDVRTPFFPDEAARLIRAGADVNVVGQHGSVLHEVMKTCFKHKGHVHDTRNLMAWTRALIAAGLNVRALDQHGQTVMHWCALHARLDLAQVVWKAAGTNDANVMGIADDQGRTPWDLLPARARDVWRQRWTDQERRLLRKAIASDVVMTNGLNPLPSNEPAPATPRRSRRL